MVKFIKHLKSRLAHQTVDEKDREEKEKQLAEKTARLRKSRQAVCRRQDINDNLPNVWDEEARYARRAFRT